MTMTTATPTMDSATLQTLLNRHSLGPRWMVPPGPNPEQLQLALRAALRAPNHGRLQPWRIVVIGPEQRTALAALFERFARDSGKPDEDIAAERERAFNGPVLLAWVARIDPTVDKVPEHEQWHMRMGLDGYPDTIPPAHHDPDRKPIRHLRHPQRT